MIGEIDTNLSVSAYQPSPMIADFVSGVKQEYQKGHDILHKSWTELNDYSVLERMNKDQRTFNSYVDESVESPNEAWKWIGTRSLAHKKARSMHAHLTAQYVVPMVTALNEHQENDVLMADVMRDVLDWMTQTSNYRPSFLLATQGMLVNPVTYMQVDFATVLQKVKVMTERGAFTTKEIVDEILSGFQTRVRSADQVFITNAYEQNIQKQRVIFERRYVEYSEAKAMFGEHENFQFVKKGVRSVLSEDEGLFYDVKDDEHPSLVAIEIYKNRREDIEVPFVNGIFMGDSDLESNRVKHRDERDAPKYNLVPFVYERINEHFFYGKSLINAIGWDDQLIDAMYAMTMNREILDLLQPLVVSGVDKVDVNVVFPGAVTAFADKDVRVSSVLPQRNSMAGYNAMQKIEESIAEGSVSEVQEGQLPNASQKAYTVARAENNAKVLLSAVGKSLGESVAQVGQLMIDIALHNLTAPQVDEITGGINYRNFLLEDQEVDGKSVSKYLIFDEMLVGRKMTKSEQDAMALAMVDGMDIDKLKKHVYRINPYLFSKMKYLVRISPDEMMPKNESFERAIAIELYQIFRQDPLINAEKFVRAIARPFFKGNTDEFITETSNVAGATARVDRDIKGSQYGNMAMQKALATEPNMASMV